MLIVVSVTILVNGLKRISGSVVGTEKSGGNQMEIYAFIIICWRPSSWKRLGSVVMVIRE